MDVNQYSLMTSNCVKSQEKGESSCRIWSVAWQKVCAGEQQEGWVAVKSKWRKASGSIFILIIVDSYKVLFACCALGFLFRRVSNHNLCWTPFRYPLLLWLMNRITKWVCDPESGSMQTSSWNLEEPSGRQRERLRAGGLIDIKLAVKVKELWTGSKTTENIGRRELHWALS